MYQLKTLAAAAILLLLLSCSKEDSDEMEGGLFRQPVITGYQLRSTDGSPVGEVGRPNVQLEKNGIFLVTFPNPAVHGLALRLMKRSSNQRVKIFLLPAVTDIADSPHYTFSNSTFVQTASPLVEIETTKDYIHLDVRNLANGFYRLYINIDGTLLWDNILLTDQPK